MTHKEKLQKITEAIQKACPDLLELKRGSRVLFQNKEEIILFYESEPKGGLPATFMLLNINDNRIHSEYVSWIDEILGQPIGGLEVLRTLSNHSENLPPTFGTFHIACNDGLILGFVDRIAIIFDLTKTLDQQEEPVISLLYSILCT